MICSIKRANGSTDFHQWGLNCQELNMSDDQLTEMLDDFGITDQNQRDEFWNAYVNCKPLTASDFINFAVYGTQGGGLAKWVEENKCYVFVTPPAGGIMLGVGDPVPEEWSVEPTCNAFLDDHLDDESYMGN